MITTIQFKTLDDLYQFYNDAIFNGELSECIVNMSRLQGRCGVAPLVRSESGGKTVFRASCRIVRADRHL